MDFKRITQCLCFAGPAVGAELILVQTNYFQNTFQRLIAQGTETHFLTDWLQQAVTLSHS